MLSRNETILRLSGNFVSTDSYSNVFAFVDVDGNVFLYDVLNKVSASFRVPTRYAYALRLTTNGVLLCWEGCYFYAFQGEPLWGIEAKGVFGKPSGYSTFYIPDALANRVYKVKNGIVIKNVTTDLPLSVASCGGLVAVGSWSSVKLFDDSLNSIGEFYGFKRVKALAFSPDCKYLVVADSLNDRVVIMDTSGKVIRELKYSVPVNALSWKGDVMVVGLDNGRVIVYKVEGYGPLLEETITLSKPLGGPIDALSSLLILTLLAIIGISFLRRE